MNPLLANFILPNAYGKCEVVSVKGAKSWIAGQPYAIEVTIQWIFEDYFKEGIFHETSNTLVAHAGFTWQQNLNLYLHYKIGNEEEQIVKYYMPDMGWSGLAATGTVTISIPASYRIGSKSVKFYAVGSAVYKMANEGCVYTHLPGYNYTFWHAERYNFWETQVACACQSASGSSLGTYRTEPENSGKITIGLNPPTAKFTYTATPPLDAPLVIEFDASSSINGAANISSYKWEWGDGTAPETKNTAYAEHTYSKVGTFICKLTVASSVGSSSQSASISVSSAPTSMSFDPNKCYFPNDIKLGQEPKILLYVLNMGAAGTARIDENLTGKTKEPLTSNIAIPGYNTPTGTRIIIPPHPIDWYIGEIPTEEGWYTIYFHLISNNIEVDDINFTFHLVFDPVNHDCPAGYHWDDITQACVKDTEDKAAETFWDKYGKYILAAGGVAAVVGGAALLLSDKKKKS